MKPDSVAGAAKMFVGTNSFEGADYTGVDLVGTKAGVAKLNSVLT